jgi:hypothetical protein
LAEDNESPPSKDTSTGPVTTDGVWRDTADNKHLGKSPLGRESSDAAYMRKTFYRTAKFGRTKNSARCILVRGEPSEFEKLSDKKSLNSIIINR